MAEKRPQNPAGEGRIRCAVALVVAYTATATVFFSETDDGFVLNGLALFVLHSGHLSHRAGRGMMSVHESGLSARPQRPEPKQQQTLGIYQAVRRIVRLLYAIFAVALIYAIAIMVQYSQVTLDRLSVFSDRWPGPAGCGL
ncbi:hypothetical protein B0I35DRAFT_161403 [Stachybotrys elegans]|uniref:Uncharacterized protein n=1 Tax=Stachybotrys elegans TaxID=80388 RepID=A0A8K0WTR2_9HYPO|nr:hypothetical protein B0I35DRAFT_161403 [Stachybotrys elegans]